MITGAASGIGAATAQRFAKHGAKVHVCDRNTLGAEEVAAAIGNGAVAHTVDVSDPAAVEALAEAVFAEDGAVDVLHNNAGIGWSGPVEEMTLQEWEDLIGVNLMGVIYGTHAFLPRLLAQGRPAHIVNTASSAGLFPAPYLSAYTASKFGVVGLSQALNVELAPRGVRVTAICPGAIDTPFVADVANPKLGGDRVTELVRRFGRQPDAVAKAVLNSIGTRKVIVTPHIEFVQPPWWLQRLSPQTYQLAAQTALRLRRT
ncbi:SDR family oxidoreductase [Janibacter hoylei]|uniref:SDR family oxidoreductase n=1 Tax=Janibacter hoylei TaxID=364298 RepID=UPI0021A73017|nr:SDR family oxidoreductase [Janibacter hoylei]MCT2291770.1 SDR family oxidoreductase [Janibacter hoylei]